MKQLFYIFLFLIPVFVKGQAWYAVDSGLYNSSAYAKCLTVYNSELYAGGAFTRAGSVAAFRIARWNGIAWDSLKGEVIGVPNALGTYNNELYMGGLFSSISGVTNAYRIARWNGTQWQSAGGGAGVNGTINSLVSHNNQLYAGGDITVMGGVAVNRIAKWNGTNWSNVGGGLSGGFMTNVYTMAVYNNELYVGGDFTIAGGKTCNYIARWNGSQWDSVSTGLNYPLLSLVVDTVNNVLYAGGGHTIAGGVPVKYVSKWDGTNWSAVGNAITSGAPVLAMYHNELYAAGQSATGSINDTIIAKWDGVNWTHVKGPNNTVTSMQVYHDSLFVGGYFDAVLSTPAKAIAKLYTPNPIGIKKNKSHEVFLGNAEPNPFTLSTNIPYQLPNDVSEGVLQIKDMQGKLLKSIIITKDKASAEITMDELDNGVYTYSLYISNVLVETKRMILMK